MPRLTDKIQAEQRFRELCREGNLPQPDEVEYGYTCVRFLFHDSKTCVVVDLVDDADGPFTVVGP